MSRHLAVVMLIVSLGLSSGYPSSAAFTSTVESTHGAAIAPHVLAATENGRSTSFLVVLRDQADASRAASLPTRIEKGQYVYDTLRETALRTQPPLRAELRRLGIAYRAFYIVNMIELTGDRDLVLKLAARPDVARIEANPQISNFKSQTSKSPISNLESPLPNTQYPTAIEWNIQKVNAPAAWAMGYTGQGVVIAGADTGYQWDHPALKPHYRGWNGITVTHDYNWHDAIHASDACGGDSPVPCDPFGHGTHTMGTMVGDDGGSNQIGMAPGAQWIGCRNMDSAGYGSPARYTECFEFFLAPYPIGGSAITQGVPSLAPAAIGNSWTCPDYEGCSVLTLQTIVDNVRAAGIDVVAAAGNDGPGCSSVAEPPGIYASAFTVGATNSADGIASFSGRGPVTSDGSNRRKPDITAPGVSIRSSVPGGGYGSSQGTSMATPHVVGMLALLWSAAPGLKHNLAASENVITSTALHLTTSQGCGGDTPTSVPNNVYGWGRIDALAAAQAVSAWPSLRLALTAPTNPVTATRLMTYTLVAANPSSVAANYNVTVTDALPPSVQFASASAGGVYSPAAHLVTWLAPTLDAQAALTLTVAVTVGNVPSGTLIVNHAYRAQSDQVPDGVGGLPVTVRVVSTPPLADLQIAKSATEGPALIGDLITYSLVVSNPSLADNTGVIIFDTLPVSVTFASTSPGGIYSDTTRTVTWSASVLAAQSSLTFTLSVTVGVALSGTLIVNSGYGAHSDQIRRLVSGPPVTTTVIAPGYTYYVYLPLITTP